MNWEDLDTIDWQAPQSTADWAKILGALLDLAKLADTPERRDRVANALDDFASNSSTDSDLAALSKLDASARLSARALRNTTIQDRLAELKAAAGDYAAALKELDGARQALNKQTQLLRATKVLEVTSALTSTIGALQGLAQTVQSQDAAAEQLMAAIEQAVDSSAALRALLEKKSG